MKQLIIYFYLLFLLAINIEAMKNEKIIKGKNFLIGDGSTHAHIDWKTGDFTEHFIYIHNPKNASMASLFLAKHMWKYEPITPSCYRSAVFLLEIEAKKKYEKLDKIYKISPDLDFNLSYGIATKDEFLLNQMKAKAIKLFEELKEIYNQVSILRKRMVNGYVTLKRLDLTNQNMIPVYILDQFLEFFSWNLMRYPNWKNIYENNFIFISSVQAIGTLDLEGDLMFWNILFRYADTTHISFTRQDENFNAIDHPKNWKARFNKLMEMVYRYRDEETHWSTKYYFEFQHYLNGHHEEWEKEHNTVQKFHKAANKKISQKALIFKTGNTLHTKSESIAENIYNNRIQALEDYFLLQPKYDETFLDEETKKKKILKSKKKKENKIELDEDKFEEVEDVENEEDEMSYESSFDANNRFLLLSDEHVEMKIEVPITETEKENEYHDYFSYSIIYTKLIRPKKNPEHIFARLYQRLWLPKNGNEPPAKGFEHYLVADTMPESIFKDLIGDDSFGTKEKKLFRELEVDIKENFLHVHAFYTENESKRFKIETKSRIIIVPALRNNEFNFGQRYPVITFWNKEDLY